MTFEEKIRTLLIDHGLWPEQAKAVMEVIKKSEITKAMVSHRWGDDIEGYPAPVLMVLWMSSKSIALEWIDENCPQAFFRPMFLTPAERDAILASVD